MEQEQAKNWLKENWFRFIILMLVASSFLIPIQQLEAATYKSFIVEEVIGSDKLLITDGSSYYLITYSFFGCSSWDFSSGKVIYIDTYFSPSLFNKILVEGFSDTKTCDISNSEDLNLKKYYVDSVIDSKDNVIVIDKYGTKYLVEYGIGCLSMWRYEGKNIDIDIGGSFLDGIGDRIYLFNSDDDCKVWDADEVSSGSNAPTYPLPSYSPTPSSSCPVNSYSNGDKCTCVSGYIANPAKTGCVLAPTPTPLVCDGGFLVRNGQCISYTQDCINTFGSNVVGSLGPDNNSSCNCASGYQWNNTQTACIKVITPQPVLIPIPAQNVPPAVSVPKKEFLLDNSKIKNYKPELLGEINTSAALRECPSTGDCDVLRYYVEGVQVKILGDYNNGEWYKIIVVDTQQEGWMHSSIVNKVALQEAKPQPNELKENDGNISEKIPVSEKTQKDVPWYKKVFGFFSNLFK